MKKLIRVLLALGIVLSYLLSTIFVKASGSLLIDCNMTGTVGHPFREGYTYTDYAQQFKLDNDTTVDEVHIRLARTSDDDYTGKNLIFALRATDAEGKPTGSNLAYVSTPGNSINTSTQGAGNETLEFADVELNAGQIYVWQVYTDFSTEGYGFSLADGGNVLSERYWYSGDGGTTWVLGNASIDLSFQIYGDIGTPPTVSTEETTSITYSSATLNGNLTSLGDFAEVLVGMRIRENGTTVYSNYYPDSPEMTETGVYNVTVTGLSQNTTYDVGAFAYYNEATQVAYGDVDQFDTLASAGPTPVITAPTVTTDYFIPVDSTTVTLHGTVVLLGSADSVAVSFNVGTAIPMEWNYNAEPATLTDAGAFEITITGLTPGDMYYYQAKAVGDAIGYGETFIFGTAEPNTTDPVVITLDATTVGNTSAILEGELIQVGNHTPVSLWFQIRPAGENTWHTVTPLVELSEVGTYNMTANSTTCGFGITPNTWYEYRAVATNGYILNNHDVFVFGDIKTFLTNDQVTPPSFTFTLNPATGITKNTAILSGQLSNIDTTTNATIYMDYGIGEYTVHTGIVVRTGPGLVTYTASSLTPAVTYWYRARIYAGDGYIVTPSRTFTTLTEGGQTPGVTPTPTPVITPTPTPAIIGPFTLPDAWNNAAGKWMIILIGLVAIPCITVFLFRKINVSLGAYMGVAGDIAWFGWAILVEWVDKWIVLLLAMGVGAIAVAVLWKVLHGRTA